MTTAKHSTFLKSIRIRRFRSIEDSEEIELAPITVFVGANDSGKSNILKAINLFFNSEVVPGSAYDHSRDFSKVAAERLRKAEEIEIIANIKSPHHEGFITKTQLWRKEGLHLEKEPDYEIPLLPKSKTPAWLGRLNYRYVPATKDRAYMQDLMRELYQLFSKTIDKKLRVGVGGFLGHIWNQTAKISREMEKMTGIKSQIQLPQNLSGIFSLFDFQAGNGVFLNQRGDGIRVRYIPEILNFLADKRNHPSWTVRGSTIWGYEEPENNLEMGVAFEQARKFQEYSRDIQILITTHSPAFYNLIGSENCRGYYVRQSKDGKTELTPIHDPAELDESMGVMSLVTPYIADANLRLQEAKDALAKTPMAGEKTIFVEGDFDKKLIDFCVKKEFSGKEKISVYDAGGASYVPCYVKVMCAERRKNSKIKCVGLLDNDAAGKDAMKGLRSKGKIVYVPRPEGLGEIGSVCLEHLLPEKYWQHAQSQGMLEEVDEIKSLRSQSKLLGLAITDDPGDSISLKARYKIARKSDFVVYAIREMRKSGIPKELSVLVKKLVAKLGE